MILTARAQNANFASSEMVQDMTLMIACKASQTSAVNMAAIDLARWMDTRQTVIGSMSESKRTRKEDGNDLV